MPIIYFDQRVWIDLLKANEGIGAYSKYKDIYNQVIETSDSNKHQYPISSCTMIASAPASKVRSAIFLLVSGISATLKSAMIFEPNLSLIRDMDSRPSASARGYPTFMVSM